jgi:hypothetical protein
MKVMFKNEAYESLEVVVLDFLGDRALPRSGYTVEVTPVEGEAFSAVVKGAAPSEWRDANKNYGDIDEASEELVSYPVEVYRADDVGQAIGEPFVVTARKVTVL